MRTCPIGNLQISWKHGDPLADLLRGHLVYVATAFGKNAHGLLESLPDGSDASGETPGAVDMVGGTRLFDGDLVFHSDSVCGAARTSAEGAGSDGTDAHEPGCVTFWLARLHHQRLHREGIQRRVTGIACPKCRLPYFADTDTRPSHQAIMTAGMSLYQECPDHGSSVVVSGGR